MKNKADNKKNYIDTGLIEKLNQILNECGDSCSNCAICCYFSLYYKKYDEKKSVLHRKCKFLDNDNKCKIYDNRPKGCKTFPFIIKKNSILVDKRCPKSYLLSKENF